MSNFKPTITFELMSDLIEKLRIKAGVIESGERMKWGSDTELMYRAADEIEAKEKRIKELEQGINKIKAEAVNDFKNEMLYEVANKYDGNDLTEWSIGANHVFKLFARYCFDHENKLKDGE